MPRSMLGGHIDANCDSAYISGKGGGSGNGSSGMGGDTCPGDSRPARRASYVSNTLRYTLAGGVFRWLQISSGLEFERRAQVILNDIAAALYIIRMYF